METNTFHNVPSPQRTYTTQWLIFQITADKEQKNLNRLTRTEYQR